jgi:hypothetical protein
MCDNVALGQPKIVYFFAHRALVSGLLGNGFAPRLGERFRAALTANKSNRRPAESRKTPEAKAA